MSRRANDRDRSARSAPVAPAAALGNAQSRARARRKRALARGALLVAVAAAGWLITRWWLSTAEDAHRISIHVVLPLSVLALVVTFFVGQERSWNAPRRRLRQLIKDIRAGRMPIEALKDVRGGLDDLAIDVATLFHDCRRLEKRLVELQHEAELRVATRTDALQRVIGSLRLQAIRDPLTGLFNRRALDELLPRLIDHCRNSGEDLSVLMIDVDHFKQLNDHLGHAAGDDMLRSIGQLMRSSLSRPQDAGFRCGGDEFVIVMPGAPPLPARALAERLRSLVANLARTIRIDPRPALSIGVCSLSELPSPTAASMLAEADRRLYESKQTARKAREPSRDSSRAA